jgi:hypothetical protein
MSDFQGDALLFSTEDGGEIELDENNFITNDKGFETSIYLTLFGGNKKDDGAPSKKKFAYWGNLLDKNNPERRLISRTQNILEGLPATAENLLKVKEAIKLDMKWYFEESIIDNLEITTTIPVKNKIYIELKGMKNKDTIFNLKYQKNWLAKLV